MNYPGEGLHQMVAFGASVADLLADGQGLLVLLYGMVDCSSRGPISGNSMIPI